MMQPLDMPDKVSRCCRPLVFKFNFPFIFIDLLVTTRNKYFIRFIFVAKYFYFKFLLLYLNQCYWLYSFYWHLPLNTFKYFLFCLRIKFTFTVKEISLCQYEESLLQAAKTVFFNQIAVVLIAIRLFNFELILKKNLPTIWQLFFKNMCHNKYLFFLGANYLDLGHILASFTFFIVLH